MTAEKLSFVDPGDRILVFGRRQHFSRVRALAEELFPECRLDVWSGERLGGSDVHWWGHRFYREADSVSADSPSYPPGVEKEDVEDIIRRCRVLRCLPDSEARVRAVAGLRTWKRILEDGGYSFALLLPVDSFVLDTLERAARLTNVPALYPVGTAFDGRIRFTDRGDLRGQIALDDEQSASLQDEADRLRDDHLRPDWLFGADSPPRVTVLRRAILDLIKIPAYAAYRVLARDPKTFSFAPWPIMRTTMHSTPGRAWAALRAEAEAVEELPSTFAFLPLQMYPEVSNQYWIREHGALDHHEAILRLADRLGREMPVVVKEHPAGLGRRSARVVHALRDMDEVHFAPTLAPIGVLVQEAALVAGPGSTTMFQAVVNQKRVLFVGSPYYGAAGAPIIHDVDDEAQIDARVQEALSGDPPSKEVADRLLRRLFSATAPGSLGTYRPIGEPFSGEPKEPRATDKMLELLDSAVDDLREDTRGR